jgi:hypothetical protein
MSAQFLLLVRVTRSLEKRVAFGGGMESDSGQSRSDCVQMYVVMR